jgi:DNA-binding PadR family transcriptional regulator
MGERHWHGWTEGLRYHRSRHHRGHGSRSMWGWPGHSMGSGPRARRGDIRTGVLALLAESPMHGYQIIQELEARSGGVWRPSPGSVYPTLQLLADEGLVSGEEENGKRVYSLTEAGHALVEKEGVRENAPWADVAEGAEKGLMERLLPVGRRRYAGRADGVGGRRQAHHRRPHRGPPAGLRSPGRRRVAWRGDRKVRVT